MHISNRYGLSLFALAIGVLLVTAFYLLGGLTSAQGPARVEARYEVSG